MSTNESFKETFLRMYAGRIDHVAYAITGAWVLGMIIRLFMGGSMDFRSAILGLVGNLLVVAIALTIKMTRKG